MKPLSRLLIVDDEPNIRRILQVAFEKEGFAVTLADNARNAIKVLEANGADCVLTDATMPGGSGYDLLREIKRSSPEIPVILMTAFGTIPQAIQSIRDGAFEFVTKPFDLDSLKKIVASSIRAPAIAKAKKHRAGSNSDLIAASAEMADVLATVTRVADSKATVMIGGESGVGKEVVARALHSQSSRASGPFVAVSCAALPETLLESELFGHEKGAFTGAQSAKPGRFELADGGTLFLDEIGEIPLSVQVKLLRVLQEREVERLGSSKPNSIDVRVVTATHRNLHDAVAAGTFRLDLLYRLQVIELEIPALRDRKADIAPLAEHFLTKFCVASGRSAMRLQPNAIRCLEAYAWPGNVRELENVMERSVAMAGLKCEELGPELLPKHLQKAA